MSSYQEYFTKLKTAKIKGLAAPHKAVILLSVIDLFERKEVGENAFYPDDRLESKFKQLWETHVGNSPVFQPTFATPFYHLGSEPFWSLRVADGAEMEKLHGTPGIGYLRKQKVFAVLSDDLFNDMQSARQREKMRSLLISMYLTPNSADNESPSQNRSTAELESAVAELTSRLEKAIADNEDLTEVLRSQEVITANLAAQMKAEIVRRDEQIARLKNEAGDLKEALESLRGVLSKVPRHALPDEGMVPSGLDDYRFLKRMDDHEMPELPGDYRSVRYVYSRQDRAHYEIQHSLLHDDENLLSTLRVRLYEQYQADPGNPLLVCSCCRRPVLLSGNSGVKGEIIGFRHHGEVNARTGEHEGEFFGVPKQESLRELLPLKDCFLHLRDLFVEFEASDSFLLMPGSDRKKSVGDITFSLDGQRIAVIFASVGHPLDFIIRRARAAHDRGYLPIWILSSSYFNASELSNRDISTFSKGFLCTIDDEAVEESEYHAVPCIKVLDFYNGSVSIVRLSSFLPYIQESIEELMKRPEWIGAVERVKRPRISTKAKVSSNPNTVGKKPDAPKPLVPKMKKTVSAIDYWKGKRQHLMDELFLERLDSGIGIVDLKTQRYPVLPFYDRARITEDGTEVEFYLKGELSFTFKI